MLFDQRRTIPYGTIQDLGNTARRILGPAWMSGDPEKIGAAHAQFLEEFGHIRLSYGLKYNGVELEKLSPGTKGIVLLILYLGMDVADSRPLVVDQPELVHTCVDRCVD